MPDEGILPEPCTWDYVWDLPYEGAELKGPWKDFLVYTTCRQRHSCVISARIHSIAADGTLSPSYVCPSGGCTFHESVRLVGWEPDKTKRTRLTTDR